MKLIREFIYTIASLGKGLWVTIVYLFQPKVTLRYPKERWDPPARFRGLPTLIYNSEKGDFACVACMACQTICPVQTITVTPATDPETGKRIPRTMAELRLNADLCMFCGLCVEACNFDAIWMSHRYEMATPNKAEVIYDKLRLRQTPDERRVWEIAKRVAAEKAAAEAAANPVASQETKPNGAQT